MEEKQISAVEWLVEQWPILESQIPTRILNEAKEMERQQIMTAFTQGDIFGSDYFDGVNITGENYYNKTFKSE